MPSGASFGRRSLLVLSLSFMASVVAAQGWYRYQELPPNTTPRMATADDAGVLCMLTRENRILRKPPAGAWSDITYWGLVSPESISSDPVTGRIYVGTARQGLFRSTDQGATWQSFWIETNPVSGFHEGYGCFAQSGTSGGFFGGHFGSPRITRFTNGGANGVIRSIANDPNASPGALHFSHGLDLFAGTHLGIWVSHDQGDSFSATHLTEGQVFAFTEDDDGVLYALHRDLATQATSLLRSENGLDWEPQPTPAEELTSIHYHAASGLLWLGTRQGVHARPVGSPTWADMSFSGGPYPVVQVIDDHNGGLLDFSLARVVQRLNGAGDGWSTETEGLVGSADRLLFDAANTLYTHTRFVSNAVSSVDAGGDAWLNALIESQVPGVRDLHISADGKLFASTARALHRSDDGGLSFVPTALPEPFLGLQTGGIGLLAVGGGAVHVVHTALPGWLFTSTDDGDTWTLASDLTPLGPTASFEGVARTPSGVLYCLQNGQHTGSTPQLFSSTDDGATWTLVPFDYSDLFTNFFDHELMVFGDRVFLVGQRRLYEALPGTPPVIASIDAPFLNTDNPLMTFTVTSDGRYIIRSFEDGVHRSTSTGWETLGLPTTVQAGPPPLANVDRYGDLPFVIIPSNNSQGIAPGIYCHLDIALGTSTADRPMRTWLYPNPATDQVSLTAEVPIRAVELLDASGRMLESGPVTSGNTVHLGLGDREPGCYLVRVVTDAGAEVHRLIRH